MGLALTALQTPVIAASDGTAELVSPALENEGGASRGPGVLGGEDRVDSN